MSDRPDARNAVLRLFAATPLAASVREDWMEWRAQLCRAHEGLPLQWLAADDLHVTLRFYGSTGAERLPLIETALARAAAAAPACVARLQRVEAWPPQKPRVLVATFDAPPALIALADALEVSARALGYGAEQRRFRPHLTLARVRGALPLPRPAVPPAVLRFPVNVLALYRSESGSRYRMLGSWPLCGIPQS